MSQSIERALDILTILGDEPQTPAEIARRLDVHRSTALRILDVLLERRMARRLPDGRYGIGGEILALAQRGHDQLDLARVARPYLTALSEAGGETVHFAELQGNAIVYTGKVDSAGPVQLTSRVGQPAVLHTASVSKAILAFLDGPRVDAILRGCDFAPFTDATIRSRAELDVVLAEVRSRGWAVDRGENEEYINAIGAPVRDATGAVVGAVSVIALKVISDLDDLQRRDLSRLLETAAAISAESGWRPPAPKEGPKPLS